MVMDLPMFESSFLLETPSGKTLVVAGTFHGLDDLICRCALDAGTAGGRGPDRKRESSSLPPTAPPRLTADKKRTLLQNAYLVCQGRILTQQNLQDLLRDRDLDSCKYSSGSILATLRLRCRILGGTDRQNRVGSKFGGGGVSSSAQSERERKERLRKLALESIDLAKDPYLIRNHLGSYECRLCLTLHRDEANYLSHTQGKKHQQGLAHRAYLEKQQQQKDGVAGTATVSSDAGAVAVVSKGGLHKVKIGRPAYQVFKSRDSDTNQRCLSFEIHYPEITDNIQPRHRFMSAFEQRVESPPDRRYQYLLFAADPYETVAFKIPNEPIDKGENRFVSYWDADTKKFTVSLYFVEPASGSEM